VDSTDAGGEREGLVPDDLLDAGAEQGFTPGDNI
jgi:hypothetical protein